MEFSYIPSHFKLYKTTWHRARSDSDQVWVPEASESSELILRADVVLFLPHVPV